MFETWILFFMLITSPGQYEVNVLEVFKTETAEKTCKATIKRLEVDFPKAYPTEVLALKDTYAFVCLKQKEKEV